MRAILDGNTVRLVVLTDGDDGASGRAFAELDASLVSDYDPAHSIAWAGAAPLVWSARRALDPDQADLFADLDVHLERLQDEARGESDDGEGPKFRGRGFTVRRIRGEGSQTTIDDFCYGFHYHRGGGMQGPRFGFYSPTGELIGIAAFAKCQNQYVAKGMQVALPEDEALSPTELVHVRFEESEYQDCVRFTLKDVTGEGERLGCGAESYFLAGCLRSFLADNRDLWRAHRLLELGLLDGSDLAASRVPESVRSWAASLLASKPKYVKVVRNFADPAVGHKGTIYAAAGAWFIGHTRPDKSRTGRRSGIGLFGRSRTKLKADERGHRHQVLRAVWEGGVGSASAYRGDDLVLTIDLAPVQAVSDSLSPHDRRHALERAWDLLAEHALSDAGLAGETVRWSFQADESGYETRLTEPKLRFASFLAHPHYQRELARRCRYLTKPLREAESAWYEAERRRAMHRGFSPRKVPLKLGALPYPTSQRRPL